MPALTINGITIPIRADTFKEDRVSIGDVYQRSVGGAMFSSMVSKRRRFTFSTPPIEASLAEKYAKLIEGSAQVWNFDSGLMSGAGVTYYSSAGAATASSPKKYGSSSLAITVNGAGFEVALANKFGVSGGWSTYGFPKQGWTVAFWAYLFVGADNVPSEGWYHFIATGTGTVTRGAVINPTNVRQYRNGVRSNWSLGNILKIDSTTTSGIFGYTIPASPSVGVATTRNFDDLVFLPFSIPDDWVSSFYAYASSFDDVTNLVTQSQDLSTTWTRSANCALAATIESPDGSYAWLANMTSGVSSTGLSIGVTYTGNGEKVISLYLKQTETLPFATPASITDINAYDNTAAANRHVVRVTWGADGSPTLSTTAGSGTRFAPVDVGKGWWRIAFTVTGVVAANSNLVFIYPAGIPAALGGVYIWGVQAENSTIAGRHVATFGSTATLNVFQGYAPAPLVDVSGDHFFEGLANQTIKCFGRVEQVSHFNYKTPANYATRPNVKILDVTLEER